MVCWFSNGLPPFGEPFEGSGRLVAALTETIEKGFPRRSVVPGWLPLRRLVPDIMSIKTQAMAASLAVMKAHLAAESGAVLGDLYGAIADGMTAGVALDAIEDEAGPEP